MYKILFFSPSPRNILEVKAEIVKNVYKKHDMIWMKYYKEKEAYVKARQFFLNSAENYDYLCILPDDLIINKEGFDNLMMELEHPSINFKRYDVLAGICNTSCLNSEQMGQVAASEAEIPLPNNTGGFTIWPYLIKFKDLYARPENILKCRFIGFSVYFIHRSIVEKVPFRSTDPSWGIDTFFGEDLMAYGIDQYIDKRSRFLHLRGLSAQNIKSISTNPDVLLVGKIKPHTILVKREKIVQAVDNTQLDQEHKDQITWKKGSRPKSSLNKKKIL